MTAQPLFSFTVPHVGVAKGRHRSRIAQAKSGKAFVQQYTPEKTRSFEGLVREFAAQVAGNQPLACPVDLLVLFHFAIPASWPKWKRELAAQGLVHHTKKPDCSNLVKAVEDACNGVLFKDDGQVVGVVVDKRFTSGAERVEVRGYRRNGLGCSDGRDASLPFAGLPSAQLLAAYGEASPIQTRLARAGVYQLPPVSA